MRQLPGFNISYYSTVYVSYLEKGPLPGFANMDPLDRTPTSGTNGHLSKRLSTLSTVAMAFAILKYASQTTIFEIQGLYS